MMIVVFLIPVCLGIRRPLNMKEIETIFYIDFIAFFYVLSEYTSLGKWLSIVVSLFYAIYTVLLSLHINSQIRKFRGEAPEKKDTGQKKKKKRKKRKSNSSDDQISDQSKPADQPPAGDDLENVQRENGTLKLEVKRLKTQSSTEKKLRFIVVPIIIALMP